MIVYVQKKNKENKNAIYPNFFIIANENESIKFLLTKTKYM